MTPRSRWLAIVVAFAATGAFVACTLNPQPLPPSDEASNFGDSDASSRADAGSFSPTPPAEDAGALNDNEGGVPTGDASDGGDGGDAGDGDGGDAAPDAG
jgi:hypothetical protein